MGSQGNILNYFFHAGPVVKFVMFLLVGVSLVSWTLIIQRAWYFRSKIYDYDNFGKRFWGSGDLSLLYADIDTNLDHRGGLASVFHAGFREMMRLRHQGHLVFESIERAMLISHAKEAALLNHHLPFFASVGSISPYIGLFGTVWGIMTSFQALGSASQVTIAMVAPGISEALVATALGLFTAIPAVIAYNRYSTYANGLLDRSVLFQDELLALIAEQTTLPIKG